MGTNTLYLALHVEAAVQECREVSTLLPPGTLVSYQVTVAPVVDFRQGFRSATWAPLWEQFFCDWRQLWFNEHIEPPSWVLGDEAIAAGAKGILFPSTMAAPGVNLVLYVMPMMSSRCSIRRGRYPKTRTRGGEALEQG
ncbi:RES family NAD+ phosphorylase [Paraburkholderia sp. RL18-103-BIB-C]|uniref:RES family NAD+ phosphorylase n=1 Tax=unclassified Paraburkholderia TaxID=2615204 RepID=UPI0038BA112B